MDPTSASPCGTLTERHQALLEVAEAISTHRDLHELFRDLVQRLPRVVDVNFVSLSLHDPLRNHIRLQTIQANVPAELLGGHEEPVDETPAGFVFLTQRPVLVPDLADEHRWPKVLHRMQEDGVNSFCVVPLTTAVRRLGAMGFSSLQKAAYSETDLELLQQVGQLVAVAVDNVLHHRDLTLDRERLRLLLEVSEAIATHRDLKVLFKELGKRLPSVVPFEFIGLILHDPLREVMRIHVIATEQTERIPDGFELPMEESISAWVLKNQQSVIMPRVNEETRFPRIIGMFRDMNVQSCCFLPLTTAVRRLGAIGFGSVNPCAFGDSEVEFLNQVAKQVAVAVDDVLNHQEAQTAQQQLAHERDRLRLLLEVTESIASHRDLEELFHDLARRLPQVVPFDFINAVLHEPARDVMRLWLLVISTPSTINPGIETPVNESPGGLVWKTQQPLTVDDIAQEHRFPKLMTMFRENGVQSFCVVPLTTAQRRLGAMGFGSLQRRTYREVDIKFMQQVASQVAVAVENVLNYETAKLAQEGLARERDRLSLMLEINNAVVSHLELRELLRAISACLARVIPHDLAWLCLYDPANQELRTHALDFPSNQDFTGAGDSIPLEGTPEGLAFTSRKTVHIKKLNLTEFPTEIMKRAAAEGLQSGCAIPLVSHEHVLGTLSVVSVNEDAFTEQDAELLGQIGAQVALAVANSTAYQEIANLKDKLKKEKLYLEEEIQTDYNFDEIVGESRSLQQVLKQVKTVAPTDSTVLILGETGSGKELVARALHNLSSRRERTFVKLNCAAIPTGLLESELFGHEKGAFTGAIATKIGRFELADRGTLFLDEVGEIPLELQVKLLRVLQEQEFERLGGTRTIRTNARVVAATNRDLAHMVEEQKFRSDLYYRLKVFPVTVPPLRERVEDIPVLARHFAQKFAMRMKKRIETIPLEAMKAMQAYPWPGNVRELGNFIERAVILSAGSDLAVPLSELKSTMTPPHESVVTLEEAERKHILKVLRDSKWTLGGPTGAAVRLGMKRTTLHSKMKKLGIIRPS